MFYLPEVFTNINSIDFGTTQLGGKLGISILPYVKYAAEYIYAGLRNSERHCRFCRIASLG
jgi:hypothetical protein